MRFDEQAMDRARDQRVQGEQQRAAAKAKLYQSSIYQVQHVPTAS